MDLRGTQICSFEPLEPRLLMSSVTLGLAELSAAELLELAPAGQVSATDSISLTSPTSTYRFSTSARGKVYIDLGGVGEGIDSYLEVFNSAGRRIKRNNNASRSTLDSRIRLSVRDGQTYYVQASAVGGTTGAYTLTLTGSPIDDAGNSLAAARSRRLRSNGSSRFNGRINYSGDSDYLKFTARKTGLVRASITATGRNNGLSTYLWAYDADGGVLAGGASSDIGFNVVAGETYYLRSTGLSNTTGRYKINIRPTLAPLLAGASTRSISLGETVSLTDELSVGEKIAYKFTPDARGRLYIDLNATGGGLDTYLEVYNTDGRRIARNDDASRSTDDSRIRLSVRAGRDYYIKVFGKGATAGTYALTVTGAKSDEAANTLTAARSIRLRSNGSGRFNGRINYSGDSDHLKFTARKTGLVRASITATGRNNNLSTYLGAYDSDGEVLAAPDSSAISFDVVAGETYYLRSTGLSNTIGRYRINIRPTLAPLLADASARGISLGETVSLADELSVGEEIAYKFTPDARGRLYIDLNATGGGLDTYLEVYNTDGRRIARNDDAARSTDDSRIRLSVRAGNDYYIKVFGKNATAGTFALTVTAAKSDDVANSLAAARDIRMRSNGSGRFNGRINYGQDVDVLKITAGVGGTMQVDMQAKGRRSHLSTGLFAYDGSGELLTQVNGADVGATATASFDVVQGGVYYIKATSSDDSTGTYRISIATAEQPPAPSPDSEATPARTPTPPADPQPGSIVTGQAYQLSGGLQLIVLGTDQADTITIGQLPDSITLTTGAGSWNFDGDFSTVVVHGFGGEDVIRLDNTVTASGVIYAGDGDDTIYDAGSGGTSIYGGLGADLIVSVGGGRDIVHGQDGTDSFWIDSTDQLDDASSSELIAGTIHRITRFYQPYTTNTASSNYVSLEIGGQDLTDPTATSYARGWRNFASMPLFVDGAQYDDIAQGAVGDCYYLAALASLCDTDPGIIQQAITSLGDGTYAIRFHRNGQEVYVRVDADLPVTYWGSLAYAKGGADGELWVPLMEKAYAFFRYGQNSYASISGGWMSTVYQEITNRYAGWGWTSGSGGLLHTRLGSYLRAGWALTLGSYSNSPGPIVGSHAYVVKSVTYSGGAQYVTVYNPWGVDGRSYDSNPSDGLLTLSIQQVQRSFMAFAISFA